MVPRTGFEPAHPCGRCDLNTVRLPISPSGQLSFRAANIGGKNKLTHVIKQFFLARFFPAFPANEQNAGNYQYSAYNLLCKYFFAKNKMRLHYG